MTFALWNVLIAVNQYEFSRTFWFTTDPRGCYTVLVHGGLLSRARNSPYIETFYFILFIFLPFFFIIIFFVIRFEFLVARPPFQANTRSVSFAAAKAIYLLFRVASHTVFKCTADRRPCIFIISLRFHLVYMQIGRNPQHQPSAAQPFASRHPPVRSSLAPSLPPRRYSLDTIVLSRFSARTILLLYFTRVFVYKHVHHTVRWYDK